MRSGGCRAPGGGRMLDPFLRERWARAKFEMEVREVLVDQGVLR